MHSSVSELFRLALPIIITAAIVVRISRFEADHAVVTQTLPPGITGPVACFHSVTGLTPPPPTNPFDDEDPDRLAMAQWHTQLMAVHDGTLCAGATSTVETPGIAWNGSMTSPCFLDVLHARTLLPDEVQYVTTTETPVLVNGLATVAKIIIVCIACLAIILVR